MMEAMMMNDPDQEQDEVEVCDRRLSRAARRLLEDLLRQRVFGEDSSLVHNKRNMDDDIDIWTLLERWLRDARPSECPLFPSRDVLRYDEEQSIAIAGSSSSADYKGAYPLVTLNERRKRNPKRTQQLFWWRCGICAKVFSTRYYMDLHLKTHHNPDRVNMLSTSTAARVATAKKMVCPAEEWCRMLGEANCHERALLDEPFYDRGSEGWGDAATAKFIQHKHSKIAQSIGCDMASIRTECLQLLDSCRLYDDISISLCESLTCPSHHRYFWNDPSSLIPEDWHSIWLYETQHHRSGTMIGILFCVLICAWVYYMTIATTTMTTMRSKKANRLNPGGKRLQVPQKSSPRRPTTMISTKATTSNSTTTIRNRQRDNMGPATAAGGKIE